MENALSRKSCCVTRIIDSGINALCPNGIKQKNDICHNVIVTFGCNNVIHGFTNVYHAGSGDKYGTQQQQESNERNLFKYLYIYIYIGDDILATVLFAMLYLSLSP